MNSLVIASLCSAMASNYNPACTSAVRAGAMQTGVSNDLESIERYVGKKLQHLDASQPMITYLGVAYRVGISKSINYSVSNFMTCDRLSVGISQTSASMGFEWRF